MAQDDGLHWYSGLRGNLAFGGSINAKAPPDSLKADLDFGGGGSVFWGFHLPDGFDAELELAYRNQQLGNGVVDGTAVKLGGYGQMFAPMANVYWTAPVDFPVKPFIGGGLGYAWNEIGIDSVNGTSITPVHDDNWRFAYNGMVGIVIPMRATSRVTIGYRWLHENVDVSCTTGVSCSGNLNSHSIDVGYSLDL